MLLAQISNSPADALSIPKSTPAIVGVVAFTSDPAHVMLPPVIPLVVNVVLFNVNQGDAFEFTCMFLIIVV